MGPIPLSQLVLLLPPTAEVDLKLVERHLPYNKCTDGRWTALSQDHAKSHKHHLKGFEAMVNDITAACEQEASSTTTVTLQTNSSYTPQPDQRLDFCQPNGYFVLSARREEDYSRSDRRPLVVALKEDECGHTAGHDVVHWDDVAVPVEYKTEDAEKLDVSTTSCQRSLYSISSCMLG